MILKGSDAIDCALQYDLRTLLSTALCDAIDLPLYLPVNRTINSVFPGGEYNAVVLAVHIAPDPNHPKLNEFLAEVL